MRWRWSFGLAILFAVSAAVNAAEVAQPADPVTQFHHGPDHLGAFDGPAPANLLRQLWRFDTGNRVIASPVVADGVVYIGSMSGIFHAVDAKTGKERWQFPADGPISATAAVTPERIFFQTNANTVFALSRDGHEIWRHAAGANLEWHNVAAMPDASDWDYYASSPLVVDDALVIGSGDGNVYCLDPATGNERWHYQTKSRVRATPASDGKTVYAGSFDGTMVALDLKKGGAPKWKFKTAGNTYFPNGEIQSSPALADGLVLFGSRDANLYALDSKTGKEVWKNSHGGSWVIGTPAVKDGVVYVGSSDAKFIRAVDLKTGAEIWTKDVGSNVFSSPAIAGGFLFAGAFDGSFLQLSLKDHTGTGLIFDERIYSSPWVEDGVVYITLNDGTVRALTAGEMPKG
jgi:outer membrane protein assembly factor BamB